MSKKEFIAAIIDKIGIPEVKSARFSIPFELLGLGAYDIQQELRKHWDNVYVQETMNRAYSFGTLTSGILVFFD